MADIAAITCADLATMGPDGITTLMFWINGHMGGQAEDPTCDLERLGTDIDGAVAPCAESPDLTVMEVLQTAENGCPPP